VPCLEGAQLVQEIFEENKSEILHGAIIWTPMIDTDSLEAANLREPGFADSRVKQFWDPDRILGRLLSQTLRLRISIAWDVYLIYLPDHPWDGELPPEPEFWMHQQDEEMSLYLDPPRLKHYVQTVLGRIAFR
jgi:hypothetical protein